MLRLFDLILIAISKRGGSVFTFWHSLNYHKFIFSMSSACRRKAIDGNRWLLKDVRPYHLSDVVQGPVEFFGQQPSSQLAQFSQQFLTSPLSEPPGDLCFVEYQLFERLRLVTESRTGEVSFTIELMKAIGFEEGGNILL